MKNHLRRRVVFAGCLIPMLMFGGCVLAGHDFMNHVAESDAALPVPVVAFRPVLAQQVVQEVQAGRIVSNKDPGVPFTRLPKRFEMAAYGGIVITRWTDGTLLVFFPTTGFRGSPSGYLYSSTPLKSKKIKAFMGAMTTEMQDVELGRKVDAHWWRIDGCIDNQT